MCLHCRNACHGCQRRGSQPRFATGANGQVHRNEPAVVDLRESTDSFQEYQLLKCGRLVGMPSCSPKQARLQYPRCIPTWMS